MGFRLRLRECRPPPSWGRWKHKTVGRNYPTWFTPVLKFIAMLITIRRVVFLLAMELKDSEFSPKQKATLFFVFAAYVCTYLIRVNISIALPLLGEMGMSATKQGILSGSFLWCYAVGQLVFGRLGDRFSGKKLIFTGLFGSAVCNLVFGLLTDQTALICAWAINGIFQSMIWSPIVHTLSVNFSGKKLVRATAYLPFAIVLGYMLAWGLSSVYSRFFGWRSIFLIPSAVCIVFCFAFLIFFKEETTTKKEKTETKTHPKITSDKRALAVLVSVLLCAITHGMIRESINYWFPTLISSFKTISPIVSILILLTVPIINFFGTLVSRALIKKSKNNVFRNIALLSFAALVFAAVTAVTRNFGEVFLITFTVILLGTMFGITPLFTSFMPLHFIKYDLVGTIAGMTDAFIYFGAAASGMLTGSLIEKNGWSAVCAYWLITAAVSFVLVLISCRLKKKSDLKI